MVAGVAGAAVLLLGDAIVDHPGPYPVDDLWAGHMIRSRSPALTFLAERILHVLGRFPVTFLLVGAAALVLARLGRRSAAIVLLVAELVSWGTNHAIKAFVDRPRPPGGLVDSATGSYTSGHVAFAAVTAMLFVALLAPAGRRWGWAVAGALFVLAMAWSRTYLMVHWLTDVVAGAAWGASIGLAVWIGGRYLSRDLKGGV